MKNTTTDTSDSGNKRNPIALLLLTKHLPVGLAVGIKAITFTSFPSGFQFRPSDVPIRSTFLRHVTQVLPKLFDGRPTKKPVALVDLEYDETRFEDEDMRIIGLWSGSVYSAMSKSF